MQILVITNMCDNLVNPNLSNLLTAANKLDGKCDVLVLGTNESLLANALSRLPKFKIINKIISLEDNSAAHGVIFAENFSKSVAQIARSYTHVLVAGDSVGKDLLPRVAGILDMGQMSEVVDILSPNVFKRFMYAGNVLAEVEALDDIRLLTVRVANFEEYQVVKQDVDSLTVENFNNIDVKNTKQNLLETNLMNDHADAVDLTRAKVIVSGGRSLGSKENFDKYIRKLAGKLSAGVGASRASVEAGLVSNDCQVGQTGKIVAPNLYLAVGISGAVQHIAGMKNSKVVVAINHDRTAPIFEYADYGMVADLFDVVPELIDKL